MMYLLDTNTCIGYLKGRAVGVRRRLSALPKALRKERTLAQQLEFLNRFVSLPFNDTSAVIYGQIRAQLTANGTPIGSNDLLIAAIALANNLTLVTHNTREFSRVGGLRIDDWEAIL